MSAEKQLTSLGTSPTKLGTSPTKHGTSPTKLGASPTTLAPYERVRMKRVPFLRPSVLQKYLIAPYYGAMGAFTLHWQNWRWFKQEYIYEHDGPEKDAKWRKYRGEEFWRHWHLATNCWGVAAVVFAGRRLNRRFLFRRSLQTNHALMFSLTVIEFGFGLPFGAIPIELAYYAWHRIESNAAERKRLKSLSGTTQEQDGLQQGLKA